MTQSTAADSVERLRPIEDAASLVSALSAGRRCYIPPSVTSLTLTSGQAVTVLPLLDMIDAEGPVTINLPAMDETLASSITAGNPLGHNITVKGATMSSTGITAATNTTPGAGAHEVTFTVTSSSIFTVGGFAIVKSIVGTGREKVLEGCWEVLAKPSGTTVRLKVKARQATLPTLAGISSGTMLAVGTILRFASLTGMEVNGGLSGPFQNMALVGDGNGSNVYGVRLRKKSYAAFAESTSFPFAVVNFAEHGFYVIEGSSISCFDAYSCGNGQLGLSMNDAGSAIATRLVATGNNTHGIGAVTGSVIGATSGNLSGNGNHGINASSSGDITATSAVIYENVTNGVRADTEGRANVTSSKIAGNGSFGVRAFGGRIVTTSADYTGGNGGGTNNEQVQFNGCIDTSGSAQTIDFLGRQSILEGGYRTEVTLADDTATSIDLGSTARTVIVEIVSASSTSLQGSWRARTVSSENVTDIDTTGVSFTTGVLSGTTGTDGQFNVSASGQSLYFENRMGSSRIVTISIRGRIN